MRVVLSLELKAKQSAVRLRTVLIAHSNKFAAMVRVKLLKIQSQRHKIQTWNCCILNLVLKHLNRAIKHYPILYIRSLAVY